jgi:hypothetical protein
MNIKGGVIVPYCKTRWTTAYQSIDDVLRTKAVLEEVCKTILFNNLFILLLHQ